MYYTVNTARSAGAIACPSTRKVSTQSRCVSLIGSRTSALVCRAKDGGGGEQSNSNGIPAALLLFVGSAAYTLTMTREELADLVYNDDTIGEVLLPLGLGLGDLAGAALWAAALWYASPLQLLLVFLGKIEMERPSDWMMSQLGRAARLPIDDIDYVAPAWVKAAAVLGCAAGGVGIAALLAQLGDPTWSISSGLGALFAAAIFEAGRPKRLTVEEAQQLESQWQDFAQWANTKLQRTGRCHESEVFVAFRQSFGRYRSSDVISDGTIRDMIRNWQPAVERTRTGYLKGISLRSLAAPTTAAAAAAAASSESSERAAVPAAAAAELEQTRSLLDNMLQQETQAVEQQQQQPQQQKATVGSLKGSSSSSSGGGGTGPTEQ